MRRLISISAVAALALFASTAASHAQPPYYSHYNPHYYYGDDCRDQNAAAGAVAGAIIGGILGSQVGGHGGGRAAATIGGVVLGGMAGSAIARDIDCRDRPYAFHAYSDGFDGPVGHRYDWYNQDRSSYGYFQPTREYYRRGYRCRDFREDRYVHGRHVRRSGSACRRDDGNWYFR